MYPVNNYYVPNLNEKHNLTGTIMKLSTAIKTLEKAGFEIKSNSGSYFASRGQSQISFFENGANTGKTSKFTFDAKSQCAPTFGLSLKQAISFF